MGGQVLKEQKYIDFGIKLVEGCEVKTTQNDLPVAKADMIPLGHLQADLD